MILAQFCGLELIIRKLLRSFGQWLPGMELKCMVKALAMSHGNAFPCPLFYFKDTPCSGL